MQFGKGSKDHMYTYLQYTFPNTHLWSGQYPQLLVTALSTWRCFHSLHPPQTDSYPHEKMIDSSLHKNKKIRLQVVQCTGIAACTTNSCISLCLADSQAPWDALCQEGESTKQLQFFSGLQVVPDQYLAICTNTEEQEMGMGLLLVHDPRHLYNYDVKGQEIAKNLTIHKLMLSSWIALCLIVSYSHLLVLSRNVYQLYGHGNEFLLILTY